MSRARWFGVLFVLLFVGSLPAAAPPAASAHSWELNEASTAKAMLAPEQDAPQAAATATVRVRGLNARSGPGTGYRVLAVLRAGEQVDVLGKYQGCGWLYVRKGGDPELLAWIAGGPAYVALSMPCSDIPAVPDPAQASTGSAVDPAAAPPPTPIVNVRPANGAILFDRRSPGGVNKLTAENLTSADGVATMVLPGTTDAIVAFYVHQGHEATITGVPNGVFEFKFTTGSDWNARTGQFEIGGSYWLLDGRLTYASTPTTSDGWRVTLHEVEDGNVAREPIRKDQFPVLAQP
jgi:hypothetical protein